MNIKFNYLEFKNILSFGNIPTKIFFNQGLHLVTGKNGSGKSSTLLDTLSFCLFGTPYRKIKIDELLNRKTKKNLEVTCNFDINNTNYIITRGLKPNKLTIVENGNEINLLSSKRLNNDEIEAKIGINFKMFKQIISLSINHNEPFLDTSTPKKREITDELFNIAILTKIAKNIKEETKDLKLQLDINKNSVNLLTHTISNLQIRITEAESILKTFEDNKAKDISNITTEIDNKSKERDSLKLKGKTLEQQLKNCNTGKEDIITSTIDNYKKEVATFEFEIKQNTKNINFLNSNNICPTCNIEIDQTHKNFELEKLQNCNILLSQQIKELNVLILDNQKLLQDERKISNTLLLKEQEYNTCLNDYKRIQNEIKTLNVKKLEIENKKFEINIETIKNELIDKESQLQLFKDENRKLNNSISLNQKLDECIMEEGFKSFIYEQLIPILNSNINNYLKLFELPVIINFASNMDVSIKTITDNTNDVNYYSFSEGEKKRIDIAILLSFINVAKSLTNWNCNLLIIDELLDSSIDDDGLDKLIESLERIIKTNQNTCVYIISHKIKKEYVNQFDSFIELSKNKNNYSEIKINYKSIGTTHE